VTSWWWVRHGPTHAKGMIGWTDLPADLSDAAAIERLAAYLPADALVVSSDLLRTIATADAIENDRERLPHASELREIHFGAWEGKTFAEISQDDPEASQAYWSNPGDIAPPGGESWNEAGARIAKFVRRINTAHAGRNIIAVAHFAVILTQLQRASSMTPKSALTFKIDNLSITKLDFLDPEWRVSGVNMLP